MSGGDFGRPRLKPETEDACSCCGLAKCSENNDIVYCEGCDGAFHQVCYKIPVIPEGDFFCRVCASSSAPEREEESSSNDEDGRLGVVLESSGLGSCVDYFVVAALTDRLASPAVTLLDLAAACVQREHGFFQALCRRALTSSDRWLSKLAKGLKDLGYATESRWLGDDPSEIPFSLQPTQRARLLRCAFEIGMETNADLRNRVRAVELQFDRIGVDGMGRSYYIFEDSHGSFALCRETFANGRPPFVARASSSASGSSEDAKKKKKRKFTQPSSQKKKMAVVPKQGKWETVATTTTQLADVVAEMEKKTTKADGFDLWLLHTFRDNLSGHLSRARENAKIEAKKRERAARRTKAAQNNLSVGFSCNSEATTFAPDVNGLLFSVADGPRKSRRAVDYRFSDYDRQIHAATSRPRQMLL